MYTAYTTCNAAGGLAESESIENLGVYVAGVSSDPITINDESGRLVATIVATDDGYVIVYQTGKVEKYASPTKIGNARMVARWTPQDILNREG